MVVTTTFNDLEAESGFILAHARYTVSQLRGHSPGQAKMQPNLALSGPGPELKISRLYDFLVREGIAL